MKFSLSALNVSNFAGTKFVIYSSSSHASFVWFRNFGGLPDEYAAVYYPSHTPKV